MIEKWLVAIRDHPGRPPALQQLVLERLALRVDWYTGKGFASIPMLMADASAGRDTVMRATRWARSEPVGLLLQTRRGHYISPGVVIASEWQLIQPVTGETLDTGQSRTGETLGQTQSRNGTDPKSQSGRPKVAAQYSHQESSTSSTSPSALSARPSAQRAKRRARARGAKAPSPQRAQPPQPPVSSITKPVVHHEVSDDPWPLGGEEARAEIDRIITAAAGRTRLRDPEVDEEERRRQLLDAIDEWGRQHPEAAP